jgi:hypothetical protein
MRYAYETLLRLYPAQYRVVFGEEMASVFKQATGDYQPRGFLAYVAFLYAEFSGLIAGAFFAWTDEYMRSTRRPRASFVISVIVGAAITAFLQGGFYIQMKPRLSDGSANDVPFPVHDYLLPLAMAGGILLFIAIFSVAFVWNMRAIVNNPGNRSGRLKAIWMPGRDANARIPRRDQTLHRDSGSQRRVLHRRARQRRFESD